jgi:hypothetical protein
MLTFSTFMFLWIFNDSMIVALDLDISERMLSEQQKINKLLHAQNMAFSAQLLRSTEIHELLSDIRMRLKKRLSHAYYHHPQQNEEPTLRTQSAV